MVCKGPELMSLINAISYRLPEVTDRKIRNKWQQILVDAANGTLSKKPVRMPTEEESKSSDEGDCLSPDAN